MDLATKSISVFTESVHGADGVTFDDNGVNRNVTLNSNVVPAAILVNNSAGDYTLRNLINRLYSGT